MRVHEVKVFTFDELTPEAQEKALDHHRQFVYEDTQHHFDSMKEDASESASFKIETLNDNPIDGAGVFLVDAETTAKAILTNHGDICKTHGIAKTFLDQWQALNTLKDSCEEQLDRLNEIEEWNAGDKESARQNELRLSQVEDEIEELENEFAKDIGHEYGVLWSQELGYQTSDEAIKETIEANEYEFLEDGSSPRF
jgi:hypothetical protein